MIQSKIRLAGIIEESITDGPGIRYTIFVQGCIHNCFACHNPKTHSLEDGYLKAMDEIIKEVNETSYLQGITFSGGEPFLQPDKCHYIASKIKCEYDIVCFSGYTFEELLDISNENISVREFLNDIDYLIDGRFDVNKRTLALSFRGSSNQRIIDVKSSLKNQKLIEIPL